VLNAFKSAPAAVRGSVNRFPRNLGHNRWHPNANMVGEQVADRCLRSPLRMKPLKDVHVGIAPDALQTITAFVALLLCTLANVCNG
jgi:hypothetical protein